MIFSCILLHIIHHVLKLVLWEPTGSNLLLFPSPLVILDDFAEVFKYRLRLFKAVLLIFIFGQFQPLFCYACDGFPIIFSTCEVFPIIFAKLLNALLVNGVYALTLSMSLASMSKVALTRGTPLRAGVKTNQLQVAQAISVSHWQTTISTDVCPSHPLRTPASSWLDGDSSWSA